MHLKVFYVTHYVVFQFRLLKLLFYTIFVWA